MEKRSMPVCFTNDQYKMIEKYAKEHGMLNASQALEKILKAWSGLFNNFLLFLVLRKA